MGTPELKDVLIASEAWQRAWPEMLPMFEAHRSELNASGELRLNVDGINELDKMGGMLLLTARDKGKLIGYCIWFLVHSVERAGELVAEQRPWYVKTEWRGTGLGKRLFTESLTRLKERGIKTAFPHHWGNEALGEYFQSLGARPIEWVYEMNLEQ